jgi:hypothetical protein
MSFKRLATKWTAVCFAAAAMMTATVIVPGCERKEKVIDIETPRGGVEVERTRRDGDVEVRRDRKVNVDVKRKDKDVDVDVTPGKGVDVDVK